MAVKPARYIYRNKDNPEEYAEIDIEISNVKTVPGANPGELAARLDATTHITVVTPTGRYTVDGYLKKMEEGAE